MALWDLAGIHGINRYVWSVLSAAPPGGLAMSTSTYGGLIPITTPQQEPEFNAIDAPYIVYTYARTPTGDNFWLEEEVAAYTIFASQDSDIRKITNLLATKLNKIDLSADAVNVYLKTLGAPGADLQQFDYKYISVTATQGSQPSTMEGGRHDGLVAIKYCYTHYDQATGLPARY